MRRSRGDEAAIPLAVAPWLTASGDSMRWAFRRVSALVGIVFIVVGLPLLITPIPLGLILIVIGVVILLRSSTTAKRWFLRWGRKYPETARRLRGILQKRGVRNG